MDDQQINVPMSYQLHSWARRQRSAAIGKTCRRTASAIWRFLLGRQARRQQSTCAGVASTRTP
ncbi:hypothetical protein ACQKGL_15880 [Ensifer adhaerens]|uniref:hypothetical protein n=1 Tax=Ensifer adhaerens TaxID=106592 RepID=UPI003D008057